MRREHLDNMVKGWIVGDFTPTLAKTGAVEVAVQRYRAGDYGEMHYHKVATEITVIVSGEAEMNGVSYGAGEIIVIEPNEATDFRAITDVVTTVVKLPGATNDKFLGRPDGDAQSATTETPVHA